MVKPGDKVRILLLGKDDAYYEEDRHKLIGKEAIVLESKTHWGGGFVSCALRFDTPPVASLLKLHFYQIKLHKLT